MSKTYKELIGENHKKERVPFVWDSIPEEEARIAGFESVDEYLNSLKQDEKEFK